MSLISDALRKARQEAAEKEAKERGLESPMVAGYWRRRGNLATGLLLGAAIAVAAGVIGGGLVWWLLLGDSGVAVVENAVDRRPETPESAVGQGEDQGVDSPELTEEVAVDLAEEAGTTAEPEVPVDDGSGGSDESSSVSTEPTEPRVERREVAPVEGSQSPDGDVEKLMGEEFVAEATIGDVTLSLDYLLFRAENPFAQINGVDVRVGSVIENFVVEEITENSVVLTRDGTKVVLRVR